MKTISEVSRISYELVAKRISGSIFLFFISVIGYFLMLIRYPVLIISLPLVIMGIMAHKLGLRFTIYAVPFFALGYVYIVILTAKFIVNILNINLDKKKYVEYTSVILMILFSIYFNVKHVINYKIPTTFFTQEVESLNELGKIASSQDYVLTWWDYGYPIRYYAGVKTLIDGGKHNGKVNFPVSFALTHNPIAAANIARLYVEYTDKLEVAKELNKEFKTDGFIEDMMKKYNFNNPYDFLNALNNPKFNLPEKTRDIYFYLPVRMADIFSTVALFSAINLNTGKINQPFIIATRVVGANNNGIKFANGMWVDMRGNLHVSDNIIPINSFYIGVLSKNGAYKVFKQKFNPKSPIYVIWYKPLNKILILEKKFFNSTYIQMLFLDNYDKNIFEKVISNPFVKIFKLKK
jgi:dolichyl-diphosphooligosaccharide--protein glycosyltransferase/undecaprenyl-diphosphooligosaccharide--protein glycosyltransferase